MADQEIRTTVKNLYPFSSKWHERVNRMLDAQVYAIYRRAKRLEEEKESLDEEYQQFHDALRDEDSSKLDEICKQESLF